MKITSTLCSLRMPNSTLMAWRRDHAPSAPAMSAGFQPGKCCSRKSSQAHSTGFPVHAVARIWNSRWSTHSSLPRRLARRVEGGFFAAVRR
jgi:hypothetical protein